MGRHGLEQGGQEDGVRKGWLGCRSGSICRHGVAPLGQTSQLLEHLLSTYCVPVEALCIQR